MIKIQCQKCHNFYNKWPYEIKSYKDNKKYICRSCKSNCYCLKNCKNCNLEFSSRKLENRIFCSKNCSAIFNNKKRDINFYINNKTKDAMCKNCQTRLQVDTRACLKNVICKKCKKERNKKYNKKYRSVKLAEFNCKICGKSFKSYSFGNKKTCSDKCKNIASVYIRDYQNGSRKNIWYFNKNQNKNILLESSWELKVAEKLDDKNVKWIRPDPISWYDEENKKRYYYPDFYIPDLDLYLDPKNPYCLKLDQQKLKKISQKINLIFGDIDYILQHIDKICNEGRGVTVSITHCD